MPSVLYATIVAGRVTDKTTGALPASDGSTLYWDITDEDPEPDVDWYFDDTCLTFSPDPPVIPPGDIAPPYPPGTIPPVKGTPDYPDGPEDPGPAAPATVIPVPLSFHAASATPITISTAPSALQEIDSLMRTWFRADSACSVNIQAHVVTGLDNVEVVLCYFDGTDWVPCSKGGTGPFVDVESSGTFDGRFLNLNADAMGRTLFSPFVRGGDDASPVSFGNIEAIFMTRVDEGECEDIDEGDCTPPDAIVGTDFSEWDTTDDLLDGVSPAWDGVLLNSGAGAYAYDPSDIAFDPTVPFDGVQTIKGSDKADGNGGPMFYSNYYGVGGHATFWQYAVYKLPIGFAGGTGGTSTLRGLSLWEASIRDHSNSPPGRHTFEYWWELIDDRIYFSFRDNLSFVVTREDIGPVSDLTGRFVRQIVTAEVMGDDTIRLRLCIDDACAPGTPTIYHERVMTVDRVWASFDHDGYTFEMNRAPAADHDLWFARLRYGTNLAAVGL